MKTSSEDEDERRLQYVLIKTNIMALLIRLQSTSSRRLQNVLVKVNIFVLVICLQDLFRTSCKNVFKTSSWHLAKLPSRRFQDVSSSYAVPIEMFSRCLEHVFATFLRRTAKLVIYWEWFASATLLGNYGQYTKFSRVTTVSQVLVFHFTTPFSGCLQRRITAWPNKGAFFAKILNGFNLLIFSQKKLQRRCSTGLKIDFWLRDWNIELTLVASLQIKWKKFWARKVLWRCFWKGHCATVNRRSVYKKQPSEGFFKKDFMRNFAEFTRKHLCRNLFFGVFLWILRNM